MNHQEIHEVIEKAAWSQIYDTMFDSEFDELVNEGWVAVLESGYPSDQLNGGLVWVIARTAIVHFKQWRRCDLAVGKACPHHAINWVGLRNLVAATAEIFERYGMNGSEDADTLRMAVRKAEFDLDEIDTVVVWMLGRGYKKIRIWEMLERMRVEFPKWRAYDMTRLKKIWGRYL